MKHVTSVAGRELRGLFVSPVAYVVLSLFAVLAADNFAASTAQSETSRAVAIARLRCRSGGGDAISAPWR